RHLYLPWLGICLIAAAIWAGIPRIEARSIIAVGVVSIAVMLCIAHNYLWTNNLTFFGNIVRVIPANIRGRQGYGVALLEAGKPIEAREQFEAGLRIMRTPPLLVGLAAARITLDTNCVNARPLLDEALRLQPV